MYFFFSKRPYSASGKLSFAHAGLERLKVFQQAMSISKIHKNVYWLYKVKTFVLATVLLFLKAMSNSHDVDPFDGITELDVEDIATES